MRTELVSERNVDRANWRLVHVTAPRPSCLDALRRREKLRGLLPGDTETIAGVEVKRLNSAHLRACYKIDGRLMTYETALARIERPTTQLSLPLAIPAQPKPLTLYVMPDMIGQEGKTGKRKSKAVPGILPSECSGVVIRVLKPITLWHPEMRAA